MTARPVTAICNFENRRYQITLNSEAISRKLCTEVGQPIECDLRFRVKAGGLCERVWKLGFKITFGTEIKSIGPLPSIVTPTEYIQVYFASALAHEARHVMQSAGLDQSVQKAHQWALNHWIGLPSILLGLTGSWLLLKPWQPVGEASLVQTAGYFLMVGVLSSVLVLALGRRLNDIFYLRLPAEVDARKYEEKHWQEWSPFITVTELE